VWLIHPDGTEDHQINANGMTVLLPDWSPDGKRLVVASRGGETEPIYEYDLNTETFRQLFACEDPCLGDDEPAYSPNGIKVVFVRAQLPIVHSDAIGDDVPGNCSLWIGDVATGEAKQITSNPACNREYNPRWSPDGTQLVYWRNPYENGQSTGTAVYVINADGTNQRQVTDPTMFGGEADWSHDGQWIVFTTYPMAEFNSTAKVSNLYRIHPDGTGLEQLTFNEGTDLRATQPQYTPDEKWIIFTAVTSTSRSLWVIPAEGGEPVVLAPGGIYTHDTCQP
jgi:Tol biopolymer transport system component